MSNLYHDEDADLAALSASTVAVVGYGNQGRSQALNLRDSGVSVIVGNIRDQAREAAAEDGFDVLPIEQACARADVVMLLIPDEVMPRVYEEQVAPGLSAGDLVCFASGYNVAFGLIDPDASLDVVLVAPRMIGAGVRDGYTLGRGFPCFVGVHRDASGRAKPRMLALCKGIGATRGGCIEMSLHDEASLDLFTEQGFGPAFGCALQHAIATLVDAGFPPEAVLLELYMSGELGYSFDRIAQEGMLAQHEHHSHTSQYGSLSRGARFIDLDFRPRMEKVLDEIRSGAFAREWSHEQESGQPRYQALKAAREKVPLTKWEREARRAFRMDE